MKRDCPDLESPSRPENTQRVAEAGPDNTLRPKDRLGLAALKHTAQNGPCVACFCQVRVAGRTLLRCWLAQLGLAALRQPRDRACLRLRCVGSAPLPHIHAAAAGSAFRQLRATNYVPSKNENKTNLFQDSHCETARGNASQACCPKNLSMHHFIRVENRGQQAPPGRPPLRPCPDKQKAPTVLVQRYLTGCRLAARRSGSGTRNAGPAPRGCLPGSRACHCRCAWPPVCAGSCRRQRRSSRLRAGAARPPQD